MEIFMEMQRNVTLYMNQFVCMMHERAVCETYTTFVMQSWVYVDYFYVAI